MSVALPLWLSMGISSTVDRDNLNECLFGDAGEPWFTIEELPEQLEGLSPGWRSVPGVVECLLEVVNAVVVAGHSPSQDGIRRLQKAGDVLGVNVFDDLAESLKPQVEGADELRQLIRELRKLNDSLLQPVDAMIAQLEAAGFDPPILDPADTLWLDTVRVLGTVAYADGVIEDMEATATTRVLRNVWPEKYDAVSRESILTQVLGVLESEAASEELTGLCLVRSVDAAQGTMLEDKAAHLFLRLGIALAGTDGNECKKEVRALNRLLRKRGISRIEPITAAAVAQQDPAPSGDPFAKLEALVGLKPVKGDVRRLANRIQLNSLRQSQGLRTAANSLHAVFYGNPGTGKTTVARLLASIYRELGVLRRGHLVETDRSGLVAGFVGQTALKVKEVVESARGGVLFIDEAYALARDTGSSFDYGAEAIDTLLKLMEDYRDDLVVIAAGYTTQMQTFIQSNPGLQSRFVTYLTFPDYSVEELVEMLTTISNDADYTLTPGALIKAEAIFVEAKNSSTFGNGRFVRTLFEDAVSRLATRVIEAGHRDLASLCAIEAGDLQTPLAFSA